MSTSLKASLQTQWAELTVGGSRMEAWTACPVGIGPWPAVIVLMEIFGVNAHIQDVTERVAAEGYFAIAPNYYHRTTPNLTLGYTERDVAIGRRHKAQTTRENLLADLRAVIDHLSAERRAAPRQGVGLLGFCFGGHVAYLGAALKEVSATASFYGAGLVHGAPGGGPPTLAYTDCIQGEVLCLFGDHDPLIPLAETEQVEAALQNAGVRHNVVRYANTDHGFFCDQRGSYDPSAAEDAWQRVKALFARTLAQRSLRA